MEANAAIESWQRLKGKIAPEVLIAPKTGGDSEGNWTKVHTRVVTYLENSVIGNPWENHLALIAAVLTAHLILWLTQNKGNIRSSSYLSLIHNL